MQIYCNSKNISCIYIEKSQTMALITLYIYYYKIQSLILICMQRPNGSILIRSSPSYLLIKASHPLI